LCTSPNIVSVFNSRMMEWAGHVARMEENGYEIIFSKPEGKRPNGRPTSR